MVGYLFVKCTCPWVLFEGDVTTPASPDFFGEEVRPSDTFLFYDCRPSRTERRVEMKTRLLMLVTVATALALLAGQVAADPGTFYSWNRVAGASAMALRPRSRACFLSAGLGH